MALRFPVLPVSDPMCATYYFANVALSIAESVVETTPEGAASRDPRTEPGWVDFFHALDKAMGATRCPCVITLDGYTCRTVQMRKHELARAVELQWYRTYGAPIAYPIPPPLFMASDAVSDSMAEIMAEETSNQSPGQPSGQGRVRCFHFGGPGPRIDPAAMPWQSNSSASCCDSPETVDVPTAAAPVPAPSRKRKAPARFFA